MSNSPLVTYTKISPNRNSPRNHVIDTITIHCTAGNKNNTAKQIANLSNFTIYSVDNNSCNYAIGGDGSIALVVEESDRSWCSSSGSNDHRAITIEVASNTTGTEVNDKAFAALIDLCTDICKRNRIKQLLWKGDKSLIGQVSKQNMTVHRWFAAKSCPGDYLYNLHGKIATEVNKRLGGTTSTPSTGTGTLYRVQTGAFSKKANADALFEKIKKAGFDTYMVQSGGMYKVQVGAYSKKENADAMLKKLKAAGFDAFITTQGGTSVSTSPAKKSVNEIAKEVLQGKWGNGQDRKNRLQAAGYNYNEVQAAVNRLL